MLKRDWTIIDERASQANDEHARTYDKLIQFLEGPVKSNVERDIYITRGLLYWLKCYAHHAKDHGQDSPLTLAFQMFSGKVKYAEAFASLCQKANIQCETVSGITKLDDYQPGEVNIKKDKLQSYWNKVRLLDKWWPVHPQYVLCLIKNPVEQSGFNKTVSNNTDMKRNQLSRIRFNDFWFLTNPEIFIHKCYPDNPDDQMLPAAKRIKKSRQFMKLPYLTPVFHEYNLKLTSEETCIIDTIDGLAKISFKANRKLAKTMMCDYSLSIGERLGTDMSPFDFDSAHLVFSSRKKNHFMFEVRCPIEANYQITISGGDIASNTKKVLIKSKIVCRERMSVVRKLPIDVGQAGWGFGPVAVKAGLLKPNVNEPKIYIQPMSTGSENKSTVKMKFRIDNESMKTMEYNAELAIDGKITDDFKDFVHTTINKISSELTVVCSVPDDGEYALVIKAKTCKELEFKPICYYLLTTLENEDKVSEEYYDSSDGTSDIDDEIEELEKRLKAFIDERDKRLKPKKFITTNVDRSAYDAFCKSFRTSTKHSE